MLIFVATAVAFFLVLTYAAWRRYLWAAEKIPQADTCPYSLTDVFDDRQFVNVPHQKGIRWLTEVQHQLVKLRRQVSGRVRFTDGDRLFLIQLYRWFPTRPSPVMSNTAAARCITV